MKLKIIVNRISTVVKNLKRVNKIKRSGRSKCEFCGKWVKCTYSIPALEGGFSVCAECNEQDLLDSSGC